MHNTWNMTMQLSWSYKINILFQARGTNILQMSNVTNYNATTKNDLKKIHIVHGLWC
jgi:hypothetical protein